MTSLGVLGGRIPPTPETPCPTLLSSQGLSPEFPCTSACCCLAMRARGPGAVLVLGMVLSKGKPGQQRVLSKCWRGKGAPAQTLMGSVAVWSMGKPQTHQTMLVPGLLEHGVAECPEQDLCGDGALSWERMGKPGQVTDSNINICVCAALLGSEGRFCCLDKPCSYLRPSRTLCSSGVVPKGD